MLGLINSLFFADKNQSHVNAFDGLRGLAVVIVLLSHTSLDKVYVFPGIEFQGIGKTGVFLFFILSAYLLDRQIAIAFIKNKVNTRYWLNYFLRRFLRIYPLFLIALCIFFLAFKLGFKSPITSFESIIRHLFLLKGEGIFWSIAVEFKYYFISPFIMAICNYTFKWNINRVMGFLVLLIVAAVYVEFRYKLSEIALIRYLPIFLTGTILSIFEVLTEEKKKLNELKSNFVEVLGIVSFVMLLLTIPGLFNFIFGAKVSFYYFHKPIFYIPFSILWSLVLIAAKYGRAGYVKTVSSLKLIRFLGIISFSVYLFHIPILKVVEMKKLHIPKEIQFYVFFILVAIVCLLSNLLIERPLQKIRISYDKKN